MSRLSIELSVDDLDKIIKSDLSTSIKIKNYIIQEFAKKLRHIEKIGRICYQSQERITEDSAENFVKMLFRRGHWAMLEHSWLVFTSCPLDWDQWHHLYELTDSRFLQVLVDDRDESIPIICGNWRAWFEQIIGPAKDNKNKFELFKQLPDIIKDLFSVYGITLDRVPSEANMFLTKKPIHPTIAEFTQKVLKKSNIENIFKTWFGEN